MTKEIFQTTKGVILWLIIWTCIVGFLVFVFQPAYGALISGPAIIPAPADITDDGTIANKLTGFDEVQNFVLPTDITTDQGVILAGETIDSHMIFLNTFGMQYIMSSGAFTFSGDILGVMSDQDGVLQASTDPFLGAPGTLYGGNYFNRGFELNNIDQYWINGNVLNVMSEVTEPGDFLRVATKSVPEPTTAALVGLSLFLIGIMPRKIRNFKQ